jgi:phage terminase large subunit-like protein
MSSPMTTNLKPCAASFDIDSFYALGNDAQQVWLGQVTKEQFHRVRTDFRGHASVAQLEPDGGWLIWLFLGGRGAGKTRAGAEWVHRSVRAGSRHVALVAPTFGDVREVMIEGVSGLLNIGPDDERPRYEVSRKRLVWPNGAIGHAFSAEDPDGLRGPQFDLAWGDELAAWAEPEKTLNTLRMGLRLDDKPRLMLTTTPRPLPLLKHLTGSAEVAVSHQPTAANADNLAPGFVAAMEQAYGGSALGRQELDGLLIDDPPGALWTRNQVEAACRAKAFNPGRIIVAVDPPITGGPRADECGIVVAGVSEGGPDRRAIILADRSFGPAMPADWAAAVAGAYEEFEADAVIAEANQGGEMVRSVLRAASTDLPIKLVHATRGKHVRAEPVAALYAARRIVHAGHFPALEDQMCAFGAPDAPRASPDRVDALVWAITELLLGTRKQPRLRRL